MLAAHALPTTTTCAVQKSPSLTVAEGWLSTVVSNIPPIVPRTICFWVREYPFYAGDRLKRSGDSLARPSLAPNVRSRHFLARKRTGRKPPEAVGRKATDPPGPERGGRGFGKPGRTLRQTVGTSVQGYKRGGPGRWGCCHGHCRCCRSERCKSDGGNNDGQQEVERATGGSPTLCHRSALARLTRTAPDR